MLRRSIGPTIRIRMDLRTEDIFVLSDRVQLEMAVLNLALNARDAMLDGGELTIATRAHHISNEAGLADGDYVELSVADNGRGMPPDLVQRVFEPFFTTKRSAKAPVLA